MNHNSERGETVLGSVAIIIVAILILVGIGVAGWQFGWWLEAKNTDKQVTIDNRQKGTQTAWHDQVLADIRDINLLDSDDPRRGALVDDACNLIPRLTKPYQDTPIMEFYSEECK